MTIPALAYLAAVLVVMAEIVLADANVAIMDIFSKRNEQ
jgi:hypothetical protein